MLIKYSYLKVMPNNILLLNWGGKPQLAGKGCTYYEMLEKFLCDKEN
jgi:hypothetical protein